MLGVSKQELQERGMNTEVRNTRRRTHLTLPLALKAPRGNVRR